MVFKEHFRLEMFERSRGLAVAARNLGGIVQNEMEITDTELDTFTSLKDNLISEIERYYEDIMKESKWGA